MLSKPIVVIPRNWRGCLQIDSNPAVLQSCGALQYSIETGRTSGAALEIWKSSRREVQKPCERIRWQSLNMTKPPAAVADTTQKKNNAIGPLEHSVPFKLIPSVILRQKVLSLQLSCLWFLQRTRHASIWGAYEKQLRHRDP